MKTTLQTSRTRKGQPIRTRISPRALRAHNPRWNRSAPANRIAIRWPPESRRSRRPRTSFCSRRSHDQFNTTIYGETDRYRGIKNGRRVVFLNERYIKRLGFKADDWVDLVSHFESEMHRASRFKVVPYEIPLGCATAYYPETNVLVPIRNTADGSNQPASKSIVITIEPSEPRPRE